MMNSTTMSLATTLGILALLAGVATMAHAETTVEAGTQYVDRGATAHDTYDGDLTAEIVTISNVDTNTPGAYSVTYRVTDSSGNTAEAERAVRVLGETTPLEITAPLHGSILYVQNEARAAWTMTSKTSEAVEYVEYSVDGVDFGRYEEAPYIGRASVKKQWVSDGQHTVVATAKLAGSGEIVTAESTFTVETAPAEDDNNENGLPDNPFMTLAIDGDAWVSEMGGACTVSMQRINGNSIVDSGVPVVLCLDQRVNVTIPRALIAEDEAGVAIAAVAGDMESLFGASEAALFTGTPAGLRLMEGGCYVHVSVITSDDGGQSFTDVPLTRTAVNPVAVNIRELGEATSNTAITADALDDASGAIYCHASYVDSDVNDGLALAAAEGEWQQVPSHGGSGVIDFDLYALSSVVAPYEVVATDAPLIGDVNDDGVIEAYDATLVDYMVFWNVKRLNRYLERNDMAPVVAELADVNLDGEISEWDATLIEFTLSWGLEALNDYLRENGMALAHVGLPLNQ